MTSGLHQSQLTSFSLLLILASSASCPSVSTWLLLVVSMLRDLAMPRPW